MSAYSRKSFILPFLRLWLAFAGIALLVLAVLWAIGLLPC